MAENNSDKRILAYLDSNVMSWIASGSVEDILPKFIEKHIYPVISDVSIREFSDGAPGPELELTRKHKFYFTLAHEAVFLHGRTNFYSQLEATSSDTGFSVFDRFLQTFLRSVSGSNSVPSLSEVLSRDIKDLLNELENELSPETDTRIQKAWENARHQIHSSLELLPDFPISPNHASEMKSQGLSPFHLGNLRPPKILERIRMKLEPEHQHFIDDLLKPFQRDDNIKERVQIVAMNLIMAGFARDKRISKTDQSKSMTGAKSQFQDIYHISAASTCDMFLTGDKRCAKLAFAVYEALGLKTITCFLDRTTPQLEIRQVGAAYWP